MMNFMWGYVMGQKIQGEASRNAAAFSGSSIAARSGSDIEKIGALEDRIDRVLMVMEAMWSLLTEQGFSDEDLAARLTEIDASDGALDGRRTPPPRTCRSCMSKVAHGLMACQFCGENMPREETSPFGGL